MRLAVDGLNLGEKRAKAVPPRVFCKRVRNSLITKGLGKHSFLESAEEHENRGVNFLLFMAKSEGAGIGGVGLAASMSNGSTDFYYCQELL